jgi:hypothetical protein
MSLKCSTENLKTCCVIKVFYECLMMMMIQCELKHLDIQSDIFLDMELCLPGAFYSYFS